MIGMNTNEKRLPADSGLGWWFATLYGGHAATGSAVQCATL